MKTLFSFISALVFSQVLFASPRFLELEANSNQYLAGQAAVLTAHIRILPSNPNMEIYVHSWFDGTELKITRLSDSEAVSLQALTEGAHLWTVRAYFQDANVAHRLAAAIQTYEDDIQRINEALLVETDPQIRSDLIASRDRDYRLIGISRDQMWKNRLQVEERQLSFSAGPAARPVKVLANPVIAIHADHENGQYAVGTRATFFVEALTAFEGQDGPQEIVAYGDIVGDSTHQGIPVEFKRLGDRDFSFISNVFAAGDIGGRTFRSYLRIRSKAQADSIRLTIDRASQRRAEYIDLRNQTQDPQKKAYYTSLINELTKAIEEYARQLDALLVTVGSSQDLNFDVTSAARSSIGAQTLL